MVHFEGAFACFRSFSRFLLLGVFFLLQSREGTLCFLDIDSLHPTFVLAGALLFRHTESLVNRHPAS